MANPNGGFGRQVVTDGANAARKTLANMPKGAVVPSLIDGYLNLKSGDDLGTAAFKAAGTAMLWSIAPGAMNAQMMGGMAIEGYVGYQNWKRRAQENYKMQTYQGMVGGGYQDTQRAMTMRQAAVQAIQGSKLNARSALGGEARILNKNTTRTM